MKSNKQKSLDNQWKLMRFLGSFGWLTTPQVGAWFWPDSSIASQFNSATVLCNLAHKQKLVSKRAMPTGQVAWVLSRGGAAVLNLEYELEGATEEVFAHGLNLGFANSLWQAATQRVLQQLVHRQPHLVPIGQHGLRHNMFGMKCYELFDTVLVDTKLAQNYGVLVAADRTKATKERILARGRQLPLIVMCHAAHAPHIKELETTLTLYPLEESQLAFKVKRKLELNYFKPLL